MAHAWGGSHTTYRVKREKHRYQLRGKQLQVMINTGKIILRSQFITLPSILGRKAAAETMMVSSPCY